MGYPIYKLLRAVNRQYPNNGFINYVDVQKDMYDNYPKQMIDEDLRDLINETIQEVYKDVAVDEVYTFPTVPGQNQYELPVDCDLRDIQEVTRTFVGYNCYLSRNTDGEDVDPGYVWNWNVAFSINPLAGNIDGESRVVYTLDEGDSVEEVPTPTMEEGFIFDGWSLDGTTVIPNETILSTPVVNDTEYIAVYHNEEQAPTEPEDSENPLG